MSALERWYLFLPILVFPVSQASGINFGDTFRIFIFSFCGLLIIDLALELLFRSIRKLARAWYLTTIVAFSTNLPELSVAMTSCFKGDPLDVAPNVALGSNFANVILGLLALLCSIAVVLLSRRAKSSIFSTSKTDLLRGGRQFVFALVLSLAAVSYFEALRLGLIALVFWILITLAIAFVFVLTNFKASSGRKVSLLSQISHNDLDELISVFKADNPILDFLKFVDNILHANTNLELKSMLSSPPVTKLKLAQPEEMRAWITALPPRLTANLFEILEHFDIYTHVSSRRAIHVLSGVISLLMIALGGVLLDTSGDLMSKTFLVNKGFVAFFILSFLTSAGEFLTSYKFFLKGKLRDGWRNIADSNLANLIIACLVVLSHWLFVN